jgi:hypothetical protein
MKNKCNTRHHLTTVESPVSEIPRAQTQKGKTKNEDTNQIVKIVLL